MAGKDRDVPKQCPATDVFLALRQTTPKREQLFDLGLHPESSALVAKRLKPLPEETVDFRLGVIDSLIGRGNKMKLNFILTTCYIVLWCLIPMGCFSNSAFGQKISIVPVGAWDSSPKPIKQKKLQQNDENNKSQDGKPQANEDNNEGPIKFERQRVLPGQVIAIELSNDGTVLASGGLDKAITLHSTKDFSVLATTKAPPAMILDLMFSSDGKYLVSCGDRKQVLVFDAKDLSVKLDYKLRFRPERVTESAGGEFVVGGRSGQLATLSFSDASSKYNSTHKSFVGGLCSSSTSQTTYSAGDQSDGPYFLARKVKTLQKIVSLPDRPSRVTAGQSDQEVLVATANYALRVDVIRNKTADLWHLPDAKKVEDIIYWKQRDLYVTSDRAGYIKIWQRGKQKPLASHQVSQYDVYQVLPLDEDRLIVCGREAPPSSMSIWKLSFDDKQFPAQKLAQETLAAVKPEHAAKPTTALTESHAAENVALSANKTEMAKVVNSETAEPQEPATETAEPTSQAETENGKTISIDRKPGLWMPLNAEFEVKRINPADLNLRSDLPSTKLEQESEISKLEKAEQPIPDSLKNFEPLEILSGIVSPGGKLFLSTTDGLIRYDFDSGASIVEDQSGSPINAACIARDPVDGILIGLKDENRVLELRESGKLVSRGQLDPDLESEDLEDKTKLSVSHVVASGSDYLALSNSSVYRRVPEGTWEKEPLRTDNKPISRFSLLESRDIVTADAETTDIWNHPQSGISRKIQASKNEGHSSNSGNVLIDSASNLKVKKLVATEDGNCFCVFARVRAPTGKPLDSEPFDDTTAVTAGGCILTGSFFDNLITSNDFDWGVDGLPKKDRTVVDFYPGTTGEPKDVWFLTPKGVGLFTGKKTQFWHSQFKLDREKAELSRIDSLGDGSFIVFTTDGVHGEDVFFIRPIERSKE